MTRVKASETRERLAREAFVYSPTGVFYCVPPEMLEAHVLDEDAATAIQEGSADAGAMAGQIVFGPGCVYYLPAEKLARHALHEEEKLELRRAVMAMSLSEMDPALRAKASLFVLDYLASSFAQAEEVVAYEVSAVGARSAVSRANDRIQARGAARAEAAAAAAPESRGTRAGGGAAGTREARGTGGAWDSRESRGARDAWDAREAEGPEDSRESRGARDAWDAREIDGPQDPRDAVELARAEDVRDADESVRSLSRIEEDLADAVSLSSAASDAMDGGREGKREETVWDYSRALLAAAGAQGWRSASLGAGLRGHAEARGLDGERPWGGQGLGGQAAADATATRTLGGRMAANGGSATRLDQPATRRSESRLEDGGTLTTEESTDRNGNQAIRIHERHPGGPPPSDQARMDEEARSIESNRMTPERSEKSLEGSTTRVSDRTFRDTRDGKTTVHFHQERVTTHADGVQESSKSHITRFDDGTYEKKHTHHDADGSTYVTTLRTHGDGTSHRTSLTTRADGTTIESTEIADANGKRTITSLQTNPDGTTVKQEKTVEYRGAKKPEVRPDEKPTSGSDKPPISSDQMNKADAFLVERLHLDDLQKGEKRTYSLEALGKLGLNVSYGAGVGEVVTIERDSEHPDKFRLSLGVKAKGQVGGEFDVGVTPKAKGRVRGALEQGITLEIDASKRGEVSGLVATFLDIIDRGGDVTGLLPVADPIKTMGTVSKYAAILTRELLEMQSGGEFPEVETVDFVKKHLKSMELRGSVGPQVELAFKNTVGFKLAAELAARGGARIDFTPDGGVVVTETGSLTGTSQVRGELNERPQVTLESVPLAGTQASLGLERTYTFDANGNQTGVELKLKMAASLQVGDQVGELEGTVSLKKALPADRYAELDGYIRTGQVDKANRLIQESLVSLEFKGKYRDFTRAEVLAKLDLSKKGNGVEIEGMRRQEYPGREKVGTFRIDSSGKLVAAVSSSGDWGFFS